jgi:peptidyl-prolyl cis-trans isomerase C
MKAFIRFASASARAASRSARRAAWAACLGLLATVAMAAAVGVSPIAIGDAQNSAPQAVPGNRDDLTSASANKVIARVNGEPIVNAQREAMTDQLVFQQLRMLGSQLAQVPQEKLKTFRAQMRVQALDQLIDVKLVAQAQRTEGPPATAQEIESEKNKLKTFHKQRGETYEEYLARTGKTDAQESGELAVHIQTEKLLAKRPGGATILPTDAEMKDYYEKNLDKMKRPEMVRSSHILIKFPGDPFAYEKRPPIPDDQKKQMRKKADEILAKIKAGQDFAELAKRYSEDPKTASKGGDIDFQTRKGVVAPYGDAIWSMEIGQVSGIVETPFGYHVIKVTDRKPAGTRSFDEVKDRIRDVIAQERFSKVMTALVAELRAKAKIEILDTSGQEAAKQKPPIITVQ